ncbi:MAG: O-antigen ligase family protein, partial [Candidatus Zixiibacteriota bacterium]
LLQYVLSIHVQWLILPAVPLYNVDISAMLVITAAVLDLFLDPDAPVIAPKLTVNYLYFLGALAVCGVLGYWPGLAWRQLLSVSILVATFFALFRLSAKLPISQLINWFVILAILHSAYVLVPYIASGGVMRSFGLARSIFGHQAMAALPVALALYFGAPQRKAGRYLLGTVIILGGLIATQSRAPIAFGLVSCAFVFLVVRNRTKDTGNNGEFARLARGRVKFVIWATVGAVAATLLLSSGVFADVIDRFAELLSLDPKGTFRFRLILWEKSVMAFLDHPIFGVGPGGYKYLNDIYPHLHLDPTYAYLRQMTAHNLLLHYLAETGLLGGLALIALMVNKLRLTRSGWRQSALPASGVALALYAWAFLFALSSCIDAAWMYGQLSFLAIFFAALVARQAAEIGAGAGREADRPT